MKQPIEFRTSITILLAVLIVAVGGLWYAFGLQEGTNTSVSQPVTDASSSTATNSSNATSGVVIFAISPNNVLSPGATFVLQGTGLSGHDTIWLSASPANSPTDPKGLIATVESADSNSVTALFSSSNLSLFPSGSAYFIHLENQNGLSNSNIVLVDASPSTLSLQEPKGGEVWKSGTTYTVAWNGPLGGRDYEFSVQSADEWWNTYAIAPIVTGKLSIAWVAGTRCGIGGCSLDLPAGQYYVVVEDVNSAAQTWSSEPITISP